MYAIGFKHSSELPNKTKPDKNWIWKIPTKYLDKQARHPFTSVIISGDAMNHPDSVKKSCNVIHHGYRIVLVERITELF